jgi:hypothetical protein
MLAVSQVMPGTKLYSRRAIRSEPNPLDKCTVISIYPRAFTETKHTIQPSVYQMNAGSYEKPAFLTVGQASWWRDVDPEQPLLEIPVSSINVADSIVKDFCNGMIACNMGDKMPGLFYLVGEIGFADLMNKHKPELEYSNAKQNNWYRALVEEGDKLWARSNGNPLAIAADMKLAANALGITREWTKVYEEVRLVRCSACGSLRNSNYPVCPTCKAVVDAALAEKLNIKFAQ